MSSTVTSQQVKELRAQSGAAMMDCKKALVDAEGDLEEAIRILKERGLAKAEKKSSRATGQGRITSYIHQDRVGVLLEISCETDFVARCEDMVKLSNDLAMQIAAMSPAYISREHVPAGEIEKARAVLASNGKADEKKMDDWYGEHCLLEQAFVKDPSQRVQDVLVQAISKIGENMSVKRFVRFEVGQV